MYYKVCNVHTDGTFWSVNRTEEFPPEFRVKYVPGEWTTPAIPNTQLFVFDSLEHAKDFEYVQMGCTHTAIFECEVKEPIPVEHVAYSEWVQQYWTNKEPGLLYPAPQGTVGCSAVKMGVRV